MEEAKMNCVNHTMEHMSIASHKSLVTFTTSLNSFSHPPPIPNLPNQTSQDARKLVELANQGKLKTKEEIRDRKRKRGK